MSAFKKNYLLLLLAINLVGFSHAQNNQSSSLELILFEMTQHNIYESSSLGIAGIASAQYKRYLQMKKLTTSKLLLHYAANHHNAVVRLYALKALKEENTEISASVKQQFNDDSSSVHIFIGCINDIKKASTVAALYIY